MAGSAWSASGATSPGDGRPREGPLPRKLASGTHPPELSAQVQGCVAGGRTPHGVVGPGQHGVALQGEDRGRGGAGQHSAGVPEPHLVGREDQDSAGERPLAKPPQALGEGRAISGQALPDDPDGPPAGEHDGGVQGSGPVQPQAHGAGGGVGDVGRQPVYDGQGVEPLHQDAPPLGRDGARAQQLVQGEVLVLGQPPQAAGGEEVAPGRGRELRRVGDGGGEAALLQPADRLVDGGPGPAGDADHLQPVQQGRPRQPAEQLSLAPAGPHSPASLVLRRLPG